MTETNEATVVTEEAEQIITVSGLEEFLPVLIDWHEKQVAVVQHLRSVPAGVEVEVEGAPKFALEGENLRAYQMGIELSLHYLGKLPFLVEYDEEETVH